MDDVVIGKVTSIQRCIIRARQEYAASQDFENNFTHQDAAILNVLQACELAIDLAAYLIRKRKLGIPSESREAFELLRDAQLISPQLCQQLVKMVGFRNTVVHAYQDVNITVVISVIVSRLDDLLTFTDVVVTLEM